MHRDHRKTTAIACDRLHIVGWRDQQAKATPVLLPDPGPLTPFIKGNQQIGLRCDRPGVAVEKDPAVGPQPGAINEMCHRQPP
jgi:hypothetical protein